MSGDAHELRRTFGERLAALYGPSLRAVLLYGSYARGDFDSESDFDVLVVLDGFDRYGAEVDRTAEIASELSLQYGVSISQMFLRETEWLSGDSPFLRNVRKEAVPA
ncbi:MAG: nucleotidyltransferase domain-containing protein [Phycisphaerae bacterium]